MADPPPREVPVRKPSPTPEMELVVSVHRTAAFLTEFAEKVLEPVEVRPDEYNVLRILRGAAPVGLTLAEVGERMIHDPARLPGMVHRLRQRGLVAGALRLTVTPEGLALLSSTAGLLEGELRAQVGRIDPAHLRIAREVLDRIRAG